MPQQSARVEFRADPVWLAEVRTVAERLSLNVSAFVRMIVTQALERRRESPSALPEREPVADRVNHPPAVSIPP